jgi:hypothetical protein
MHLQFFKKCTYGNSLLFCMQRNTIFLLRYFLLYFPNLISVFQNIYAVYNSFMVFWNKAKDLSFSLNKGKSSEV